MRAPTYFTVYANLRRLRAEGQFPPSSPPHPPLSQLKDVQLREKWVPLLKQELGRAGLYESLDDGVFLPFSTHASFLLLPNQDSQANPASKRLFRQERDEGPAHGRGRVCCCRRVCLSCGFLNWKPDSGTDRSETDDS